MIKRSEVLANMGVDFGLLLGQMPRFAVGQIYNRMFEGEVWSTNEIIQVDSQFVVANNGYMGRW